MNEASKSARQQALLDRLLELSGHLQAETPHEGHRLDTLHDTLARALAHEDPGGPRARRFSFEQSDLLFADAVPAARRARLADLVERTTPPDPAEELRVVVRDVPLRTTQMDGSVPLWAGGAAVDHTLGPFVGADGRQIWFDFLTVTRLVALHMAGEPDPVLLFDTRLRKRVGKPGQPPIVDPQSEYDLSPHTIWVRATVFASGAPAGSYVGLRIKAGKVTLSAAAIVVNGKLTVPAAGVVTVRADLDQPAPANVDPSSPFGIDARDADLHLPTSITFRISGAGGAIDTVAGAISWHLYGENGTFDWSGSTAPTYEPVLNRVMVPLTYSHASFHVSTCRSPFVTLSHTAMVQRAAWALPVGLIDIAKPSPAAGIGGLAVQCHVGLAVRWRGLQGGSVALNNPYVLLDPGAIGLTDLTAGNAFCTQEYTLWKDAVNPFGSSVKLRFTAAFPFQFGATADGTEGFLTLADTNPLLDRPVTVTGRPFDIRTKSSIFLVAVNKAYNLLYLFDDNILFDNLDPNQPKSAFEPLGVALRNALFKVTPANGCMLFGRLGDDLTHVVRGHAFLAVGVYGYIPTLPDPYAANLNALRAQFERIDTPAGRSPGVQTIWLWLVSMTRWVPDTPDADKVKVSFHFAPLPGQTARATPAAPLMSASRPHAIDAPGSVLSVHPYVNVLAVSPAEMAAADRAAILHVRSDTPDYERIWKERFAAFELDTFALLDVSSNADQMGVSFAWFAGERGALVRTQVIEGFPLRARNMDVVTYGQCARAFALPQVSWEPVLNTTSLDPGDPPFGPNYYPDDGSAAKIANNSVNLVPIAPLPMCDFLVDEYANQGDNLTAAYFTLPFGLRSLAYLYKTNQSQAKKPALKLNRPTFAEVSGGLQLLLTAGSGFNEQEADMFRGYTLQMNNVLDAAGNGTNTTTLGHDVTVIFNGEFFHPSDPLDKKRGVPLTRVDLSGYGQSTVSNWINREAQFASTSQSRFEVFVGRTAHEVIHVKSILYPWAIKVVRTVTLFRVGSGYVYRVDSGWRAESDGRFDFHFKYVDGGGERDAVPYRVHPGTVRGLFNVRNIRTALADVLPMLGTMDITQFYELDPGTNKPKKYAGGASPVPLDLQPVYFDADIELENVVQGRVGNRVPSTKILGFVQLAPRGIPLTPQAFKALLDRQLGSIGAPVDCVMDLDKTGQHVRVNRVDVSSAPDASGAGPVFVAASRGSVVLPKDGSWSLVSHARAAGNVTPLPEATAVPIVRIGELALDLSFPTNELLRIANPADLVRAPNDETVNFGFLQSTNTQKVLFLTPAYAKPPNDATPGKLMSKTPPLFADAYRLAGCKGIFPNIGDAVSGFGDAIALTKDFASNALTDGGKNVLELMSINSSDGITKLKEDGYKLLNAVKSFDLPSTAWYLINEDYLKIYVEYKAQTRNRDKSTRNRTGSLNYDIDSFAADVADRWRSRMNNLAMVVDLGPLKRLMTIKGTFDAKKGSEAAYIGGSDPDFPTPQIQFSDELQPVIDVLEILEDLQGEKYGDAIKKGLKIAMSNAADSWQYKFEASKEIPLLRFPVPQTVYDDPNTPFKLEASMKIGAYFNAALTTASLSDPKKLLPTAGASLEFYGRLSVMCVSLSAATVYAVGQVTLRIAGDTGLGPSLSMKFGFGAQLVVGLPVVGSVSVLYMAGVEIYVDSTKLNVSAFLLFQGHADLLGGLVSVTITIEAKGTMSKKMLGPDSSRTDCIAQVTFALDISIFLVIDISFSKSWQEQRQIA